MATLIRMPPLGQTSDELRLIVWLVSEGQVVSEGQALFEVETDKATLEVEASASGTLLRVLCDPGQVVTAGTVVAWIGEPGEAVPELVAAGPELHQATTPAGDEAAQAPGRQPKPGRPPATPAAKTLARQAGIDLTALTGSGPDGRIQRRDVMLALEGTSSQPAAQGLTPVPWHRQAIARRLVRSAGVPQFSLSKAVGVRNAVARCTQSGVSLTNVLLQAAAAALRSVPKMNRLWVDDGPQYLQLARCDVGLAIASEDNLIVATIPEPDRSSLEELAATTGRAVEQGRSDRLAGEFSGPAALTISNLGMFGIDRFQAIVDPDQTAILAVGQVGERLALTKEGIMALPQLDLTLTVDHRTADGVTAARFLAAFAEWLEGLEDN